MARANGENAAHKGIAREIGSGGSYRVKRVGRQTRDVHTVSRSAKTLSSGKTLLVLGLTPQKKHFCSRRFGRGSNSR